MAISDRLNKLTTDITNAYTSIENKGGIIPANKNTNNLPNAIDSIEVIEQATAEGESLSLTNTKAMPYSDYIVEGKSEQATRSGKNKMKTSSSIWKSALTSAIYNSATDEFTFHRDNGTDYLIDFNKLDLEDNTKYYIKFIVSENTMEANFLDIISSSRLTGNISIPAGQTGTFDFTLASGSGTQLYDLWLYCNSTGTLKTKIMISAEQGAYEPYGASPSPDYPSEIHSVADDVNLFDYENIVVNNKFTASIVDDELIITRIASSGGYLSNTITGFEVGKEYTIKSNSSIYLYEDSVYGTLYKNTQNAQNGWTFIADKSSYVVTIILNSTDIPNIGDTLNCGKIKIQKGSVATPYSPYNQGTVTIKQRGKNLIGVINGSGTQAQVNYSIEDGVVTLNGTSNSYGYINVLSSIKTDGYYTLSIIPISGTGSTIGFRGNSGTTQKFFILGTTTATKSLTDVATCDSFDIFVIPNITYTNFKFKIQLEQGTTATSYEPYQANDYTIQTEPLRSLPNGVRDSLEDDGIHRRVGRVVLDGSDDEAWGVFKTNYYIIFVNKRKNYEAISNALICNYFKVQNYMGSVYQMGYVSESYATVGNNNIFFNYDNGADGIENFKEWLSNNPTEVLYPLATEIIEPLTQNQATTMLDIIKTGSYEGTTNIYTDEDVKPTIKADYYKKG